MITIWKTLLKVQDFQSIEVPRGAELFLAKEQNDQICIWYRCDSQNKLEPRFIAVIGTGHEFPTYGKWKHVGTASLSSGLLMFHVFEQLP